LLLLIANGLFKMFQKTEKKEQSFIFPLFFPCLNFNFGCLGGCVASLILQEDIMDQRFNHSYS